MIMPAHRPSPTAFSLVELLVILVVLVLLVAFLIPRMGTLRHRAIVEGCQNNLKQIGTAFRLWAGDGGDRYPPQVTTNRGGTMELGGSGAVFVHFRVMSNELEKDPKVLLCPADRAKIAAEGFSKGFSDTNVSYFVGLDATEDNPASFLTGDRNFATNSQRLPLGLFVMSTNSLLTWTSDLHRNRGDIAFTDGSVQLLDQARLLNAVRESASATNRLAIP